MFALKQALETYDHYQRQIKECDEKIELKMRAFDDKSGGQPKPHAKREAKKNKYNFDAQSAIWKAVGVNLMEIPGMNTKREYF